MEQEIVAAVEQIVASHIWTVIVGFIASFVIISLIKQIAVNTFEFILIKTDLFGVGSLIYYGGKKARILRIGFRRTQLYMLDTKETMHVRTVNWRKFELVNDINESNK